MSEQEQQQNEDVFLHTNADSATDKEKILVQSMRESQTSQEDASRSTLHYGEQEQAEAQRSIFEDQVVTPDSAKFQTFEETAFANPEQANEVSLDKGLKDTNPDGAAPTISPEGLDSNLTGGGIIRDSGTVELIDIDAPQADPISSDEVSSSVNAPQVAFSTNPNGVAADDEPVADSDTGPNGLLISQTGIQTDLAGAEVGEIKLSGEGSYENFSFTVSDDRFEIVDNHLKLRDEISLSDEDLGELSVDVIATGPKGATLTQTLGLEIMDVPSVNGNSGFQASYFDVDHSLSKLDQIDWSSDPTHEEVVSEINYENGSGSFWEGGSKDTFGARITGNIEVSEGGVYNFFAGGDDGVSLFVNGQEVIDNDGLHGFRTRSGELELEPGTHHIEVRYFENHGHAGLKLEWEGPGTDGRELVAAPGMEDLQTVNGLPIAFEIDAENGVSEAGENSSYVLAGLPQGTVVQGGDMSAEIDANGALDVTGWDISLLTITPPVEFTGEVNAVLVTTTRGTTGAEISSSLNLDFAVNEAIIEPAVIEMTTGFKASYFDVDHSLSKLDQIDWSSDPTHEEVVSEINYENGSGSFWEGGSKDTFGARITGNIEVSEGGVYNFFAGGDDGVSLFVNGQEVIDNDGLHGFRTRSGELELEPGTHHIEVRYFENHGHAGLKLEWEGPGTDGRELVTSNDELSVDQNGIISVHVEHEGLSEAASIKMTGLPADTILMSDGNVATSDGSEIDLTGWDLGVLEIAPPPNFTGKIVGDMIQTDTGFNGQSVTSTSEFSIQVGEVDEVQTQQVQMGDAMDLSGGSDDQSTGSWIETADNQEAAENQNENALEEEIIEQSDVDTSHEMNETYERSDW